MTRRSYNDFKNQFNQSSIKNVKVPYNVVLGELKSDVTTYDDIMEYFLPQINFKDTTETTYINITFKPIKDGKYLYKKDEYTSDIYIPEYNISDMHTPIPSELLSPVEYKVPIKLPIDQTSVIVNLPFEDSTISGFETFELKREKSVCMQYSSFNNYLIIPSYRILYENDIIKFANDIWKWGNDSSNLIYDFNFDLFLHNPIISPALNKNFKFNLTFDQSLVGMPNSNSFIYSPKKRKIPKATNITQDIIDIEYIKETDKKINGFVLLDTNITEYYGSPNLNLDTTTKIESENYYINRQHVPPSQYLANPISMSGKNVYNEIINFTLYNNVRHIKIKQHNHTQSKTNNNIFNADTISNVAETEFLIEFSGYNEVVEL